jgi:hypothetical protein
VFPPTTGVEGTVTDVKVGNGTGLTVIVATWEGLLYVPEIVAPGVASALAVKFALVCPAGTVTELGTVTEAGAEEVKGITAPPVGAGRLRITEPVGVEPTKADAGKLIPVN